MPIRALGKQSDGRYNRAQQKGFPLYHISISACHRSDVNCKRQAGAGTERVNACQVLWQSSIWFRAHYVSLPELCWVLWFDI